MPRTRRTPGRGGGTAPGLARLAHGHVTALVIEEARLRVEAAERLLSHGLLSGDVFTLDECAAHAVVLLGQAERWLERVAA